MEWMFVMVPARAYVAQALQKGMSVEEVFELTKIDRWYLENIREIVVEQARIADEYIPAHAHRTNESPQAMEQLYDELLRCIK